MESTKRSFYGKNTCTREEFLQSVLAILNGDEPNVEIDTMIAATEYELEGIAARREYAARKRGTATESKDPLESQYAKELVGAVLPLVTAEPKSAKMLADEATSMGYVNSQSGKAFPAAWVARCMNALVEKGDLAQVDMVVTSEKMDKKTGKTITSQSVAKGYKTV